MQVRRVEVGDIALEVAEAGAGGRPLMLVHGFTGGKDDFSEFCDRLAALGWHAVAPDLRGHGSSDHPPGEDSYDFGLLAGDLLGLADALGWERFTFVGHSMGGMLGQMLALEHPGRLAGLVLLSTFHGPVSGIDSNLVQLGSMIVRQTGMEGLWQALAARREANPVATAHFERMEERHPGYQDWSRRKMLATSPDLWVALAPRFLTQDDRLARLAALNIPTAVVVGADDEAMLDDCRRIAATIAGARLVVIPDAGHSPQFENEPAWWAATLELLEGL